jgi:hypothetical protein
MIVYGMPQSNTVILKYLAVYTQAESTLFSSCPMPSFFEDTQANYCDKPYLPIFIFIAIGIP